MRAFNAITQIVVAGVAKNRHRCHEVALRLALAALAKEKLRAAEGAIMVQQERLD